ncbi:heparan sulfate glucosamine 3-O-sulfotransferase 1-like [Limulus polyphemus]|uniref:Heparan sulfate glucosamine 3-O-sulfotransferase 1-like n=1 Tax=Limulus polyphemus TaxID=6850 RepID=A0ABM1BBK8_LIMPO|nr:heparan sulfate glucosamine 3-O-sulfotransferase 1-like [Limulus polyphemus]
MPVKKDAGFSTFPRHVLISLSETHQTSKNTTSGRTETRMKSRYFAVLVFLFIFFLCMIAHFSHWENLEDPELCLDSYHNEEIINLDILRERVHFIQTKRRLPQVIIIGVRKGGTRALLEFLNVHPMIQKSSEEEHFFDNDARHSLGLEWYRRKMPFSFPGQITIEKSPAYFITDKVPERIHEMNSSIKLLLIVRDPVTRLISDYSQLAANKAKKGKPLPPFEELVFKSDGQVNMNYKAVKISMYSIYLKKWLKVFNDNQILVVSGDQLISDPFLELKQIEDFLGLKHYIKRENFYYNKTKGFFCVRNETLDKCLNDSKGRKHPVIPSVLISKLRRFYTPYNREFYRAVGRSFAWLEE